MNSLNALQQPATTDSPARGSPVWWIILKHELAESWLGGRAPNLLILFSALMSITAFLLATNSELSLFDAQQMMSVALQNSITFGLFIGLVIAAESVSGERERATLEPLLLTPTNRRQIVLGKYLSALSLWPAALIVSIPYLAVLARSEPVLGRALMMGLLSGSVSAGAFTGIGMLISTISPTSRTSLFAGLLIYFLSLLPSQLPGEAQKQPLGMLVQSINPLGASQQFLQRVLGDGKPLSEAMTFLATPILLTVLILGVLFLIAAPRMTLDGARLRGKDRAEASA